MKIEIEVAAYRRRIVSRRHIVVAAVVLAGLMTAVAATAQQPPRILRVGVLHQSSPEQGKPAADAFRDGMRSLGWVEGNTVAIDDRFSNYDLPLLSANAAAFATARVDVIVAFSTRPALAALAATSTIPIVMDAGDPVATGLIASLARPGGNVTGQSLMRLDMVGKQLELLREVVPQVKKIGVLLQLDSHAVLMSNLEQAAATLGISLEPIAVGSEQDLSNGFDKMTAAGVNGYLVFNEPRTDRMRDAIAALALRHGLPGMAQDRRYVKAGVLFSYAVSLEAIHRRAAFFVDKILKGAKPADLPVEQPTTFELVVNLKTAKALGLTVPPSILARADEVIE